MKGNARRYDELRSYCEGVPLIDCHDHSGECRPKYADPIAVITSGYFNSDLLSANSEADMAVITDEKRALEERWPALERCAGYPPPSRSRASAFRQHALHNQLPVLRRE